MNIAYKILCIEDEETWFTQTKRALDEYLEERGFVPFITQNSGEDIDPLVYCDPSLNLILMDMNLGGDTKGYELIKHINEQKVFTDVIFYSGNESQAKDAIRNENLQGVYCCDRQYAVSKTKEVIDFALKRIGDTNAMRALVLSEVAVLDSVIRQTIMTKVEDLTPENRKAFALATLERFDKQYDDLTSMLNQWRGSTDTELSSMLTHNAFDSNKKANCLSSLARMFSLDKSVRTLLGNYTKDILKERNVLAHEPCTDSGCIVVDGQRYDPDKFLAIRKLLIQHKNNIESICSSLTSTANG